MGELNNVDLEVVHILAEKATWFVRQPNNVDLEVVPISAEQTYLVCGRAKQCRIRSGSYLRRTITHGL